MPSEMTSSQSNATTTKKGICPSAPHGPKTHGSKERDIKSNIDLDYISPMFEWLRQSDEDEPWRGFTAVATDQQSRAYSAQNLSQTWSTQAEAGSQEESSTEEMRQQRI
ncbi:uncharacterized protein FPRO_03644 [Fusarium proliferatum ET1]|uniref:Uncharacterized protein n=1 Tax=Fusarium proliferatum (strain ET1) TaxID=1227346 RepID=A0A1L7V997_FUSPR|nr:uncharacterized protein FPRO_03644 [Fusarium proliferatum ET1]CZR36096.1 uncharacterized protein FPRO_03644 [Fusarium proliferatum ET1]